MLVRGREIPLTVRVTGPWLVKPAPTQPLYPLVVAGIEQLRRGRRVQRDPTYWLVSAVQNRAGAWVLPDPVPDLLAEAYFYTIDYWRFAIDIATMFRRDLVDRHTARVDTRVGPDDGTSRVNQATWPVAAGAC